MRQATIEQAYALAVQHHQAGRLQDAERLYRQILTQQPDHAEAMQYLGVIAHQAGQVDAAVELIRRAIALNPESPTAYSHLANALKDKGQLDGAIAAYRHAIALNPNYAEAHNNLGVTLREKGEISEAVVACHRAVALKRDSAEAYYNLANALKDNGQLAEAIVAYRRAIALRPDYAKAYSNLGNALKDNGQVDEAITVHRQAIAVMPGSAQAQFNLGVALEEKGSLEESIGAYRQAIILNPEYAEAYCNLGNVLKTKGDLDEAIAAFRQSIAIKPDYAAYNDLGVALEHAGRQRDAIVAFHQALALRPDYADVHFNLALAQLRRGEWEQGWVEHEWRFEAKGMQPRRLFSQPCWTGQDLRGQTILLHPEQGLGDTIQFLRYVPLLADRGAKTILEVHSDLRSIAKSLPGVSHVVMWGQPLPAFDLHCPLLSLPLVFKTTPRTIPSNVPYLTPPPETLGRWRKRLAGSGTGLKVALAWAGNPNFKHDRTRSITLDHLAPLSEVRGATFYSIQKGDAASQADRSPAGLRLVNLGPELRDFADTAAVMCLMDLVITTDTSIPHLAGALARPVWMMLQFMPDWRWFLNRQDSPWYPTMRLFRQKSRGDWTGVVADVAEALAELANTDNIASP